MANVGAAVSLVVGCVMLGIYFHDLYEDFRVRSRMLLLQQTSLVLGMAFVLQAALSYGRSSYLLPKWLMVYGSVGVLLLLPGWRILFAEVVSKALGAQRVLFIGSSQAVREIMAKEGVTLEEIAYVGDDVIVSVAECMAQALPPGALSARISGDRLAALIPNSSMESAAAVAERIRAAAAGIVPSSTPAITAACAGASDSRNRCRARFAFSGIAICSTIARSWSHNASNEALRANRDRSSGGILNCRERAKSAEDGDPGGGSADCARCWTSLRSATKVK